jgi:uncharacterized protein
MRRSRRPAGVGLAYAAYVPDLVRRWPRLVDHVEIPFERLRSDPGAAGMIGQVGTVMHCASLSIAGVVPAQPALLAEVRTWAERMATPWIGEHLAFVSAPGPEPGAELLYVGYTVAPTLDGDTLERVERAVERCRGELGVAMLLENPPQYFATPGSTMDQPEFLRALCRACDVGLLLDVSHFLITARNVGFDPFRAVLELPLERVREIHLSGLRWEAGAAWDDHGVVAPPEAYELLAVALSRAEPAAITLEYNWPAAFPEATVVAEVARVRKIAAGQRLRA